MIRSLIYFFIFYYLEIPMSKRTNINSIFFKFVFFNFFPSRSLIINIITTMICINFFKIKIITIKIFFFNFYFINCSFKFTNDTTNFRRYNISTIYFNFTTQFCFKFINYYFFFFKFKIYIFFRIFVSFRFYN